MRELLTIISFLASVLALGHSLLVINAMSRCTNHLVRTLYCVLATAAFASLIYLTAGASVVTWHGTIVTVAIASICLADRRRVACECQHRAQRRMTDGHRHA